jgi:xylulose-5-phosphate/fructose-6-phosphate phosphoketolase
MQSLCPRYGYTPYFIDEGEVSEMHQRMAATLDTAIAEIRGIQRQARANGFKKRPRWPMIVLCSPKGWTGPQMLAGKRIEGSYRSHQVPMGDRNEPGHVQMLEKWLKSYRAHELFDRTGRLLPELAQLAPAGARRMSANPHANGGLLLRDLRLPDFRRYAVAVPRPGGATGEATRVQGEFIRDVIKTNPDTFRVFSPDETSSNRWGAVVGV